MSAQWHHGPSLGDCCAGSTAFSATWSQCGHLPSHPPKCCHCAVPGSLDCQSPSCCSIWREEVCAGTACLLHGHGKPWLLKTPLSLKQHQLACNSISLLASCSTPLSQKAQVVICSFPRASPASETLIYFHIPKESNTDRQTDRQTTSLGQSIESALS